MTSITIENTKQRNELIAKIATSIAYNSSADPETRLEALNILINCTKKSVKEVDE